MFQTPTLDLQPIIASTAGVPLLQRPIDGMDVKSVLAGNTSDELKRDYFLYRGNAIRVGDWKYVKDGKEEQFFNLITDKEEEKNLLVQYPEKV